MFDASRLLVLRVNPQVWLCHQECVRGFGDDEAKKLSSLGALVAELCAPQATMTYAVLDKSAFQRGQETLCWYGKTGRRRS